MMWPGVYRAVVLSTSDPQSAGRVRLQVPQVSGAAPSTWAPPVQTGGRVPAVGEVVSVLYQGADASYPVYLPPAPLPYTPPDPPAWQVQSGVVLGGITLGNGTVSSRYLVDGHVVRWAVLITWGSSTTASPSAAITIPVPVTQDPDSGMRWVGSTLINPGGGAAFKPGSAWLLPGSTTAAIEALRTSDLSYEPFSTASVTIASGGWVSMQMTYDKA